jgi:hypothetical protein
LNNTTGNSYLRGFNSTGSGNEGIVQASGQAGSASFLLKGDFDGGVKTAQIQGSADVTQSSITYSAEAHIFTGNILPSTDVTYDIGSPSNQIKDIYMGGASLYMAGTKTLSTDGLALPTSATITFGATNVVLTHTSGILTMGTGEMRITTPGTNSASVVTVGGTQTLTGKSISIGQITGLGTGVETFLATPSSANFFSAVTNETGSGLIVGATAPSMSSITLAAGTASAGTAPLYFTSGTNLTAPVSGAIEFDGTTHYLTTASGRGVSYSTMFASQTSTNSLSDVNTVQAIFASGFDIFTLQASTSYFFEGQYVFDHGAASHSVGLSFELAGGASVTSIAYATTCWVTASNTNTASQTTNFITQTTNTAVNAAGANATERIYFSGIIRMNAGGTVQPSVTFSSAPGGAPTTGINTFIRFTPIGTNTVNSVGNVN